MLTINISETLKPLNRSVELKNRCQPSEFKRKLGDLIDKEGWLYDMGTHRYVGRINGDEFKIYRRGFPFFVPKSGFNPIFYGRVIGDERISLIHGKYKTHPLVDLAIWLFFGSFFAVAILTLVVALIHLLRGDPNKQVVLTTLGPILSIAIAVLVLLSLRGLIRMEELRMGEFIESL